MADPLPTNRAFALHYNPDAPSGVCCQTRYALLPPFHNILNSRGKKKSLSQ